jgi:hypothetical protein
MSTPYVPTSSGRLGVADSLHDPAKAWRLRAGRRQKGADSRERGKRDREGQDVEGIRGRQACGRDQDSCERRTADRPGVRAERSDCIRGGKLVPLDEARRHGVERRPLEPVETRHRDPDHEQRPELGARKEGVDEQRACADGEQELRDLDEPPPVERVCERASVQRCQKERRQLREAQEADDERRSGQLVRRYGTATYVTIEPKNERPRPAVRSRKSRCLRSGPMSIVASFSSARAPPGSGTGGAGASRSVSRISSFTAAVSPALKRDQPEARRPQSRAEAGGR